MGFATAIFAYGYDLGGPGDRLGWNIPTKSDGHPDVPWYDPADPEDLDFAQQAAAHLITMKGRTPHRDGLDDITAQELWHGVHLVSYGTDEQPRWLLVAHETNTGDTEKAEPLVTDASAVHEQEWDTHLRTTLDALGVPEPSAPHWYLAAYAS